MPWTTDNLPKVVGDDWTEEEIGRCIAAANGVLGNDGEERDAIFACMRAAGRADDEETKAADEKAIQAQVERARKYGIAPKKGKAVTKPKKYSDVPEEMFGDPVNWAYPCDSGRRLAARQYFNREGQREDGGYTEREWEVIGGRIADTAGDDFEYKEGKVVPKDESKAMSMGTDTAGGFAPEPDYRDGVMSALYLPRDVAANLAIPGGVEPDDLHVTLGYFGRTGDTQLQIKKDRIAEKMGDIAKMRSPIRARINGLGRFKSSESSEGRDVLYANFDSADLDSFRSSVVNRLRSVGIDAANQHGFTPHVTLAYLDPDSDTPDVPLPDEEVVIPSVHLVWGDERMEYPLTGEVKAVSLEDFMSKVRDAWYKEFEDGTDSRPRDRYVNDVLDDAVVVRDGGQLVRYPYLVGPDDRVTFEAPQEVRLVKRYEPVMPAEIKAGRRMASGKVEELQDVRVSLQEVLERIRGLLEWANYTPDIFKQADSPAQTAEPMEVKAILESLGLPPAHLKEVKSTENGTVVGGYMAMWGDPTRLDLQGDYFTPETNFFLDHYPKAPAVFHHGQDRRIGKAVLGYRDDAYTDDVGLWVQDWLDKKHRFWDYVKGLLENKALYYSPGALGHLVDPPRSRHIKPREIKAYPIADDTLTPTPVQAPLFGQERNVGYLKAAYDLIGQPLPDSLRGAGGEPATSSGGDAERLTALLELEKTLLDCL